MWGERWLRGGEEEEDDGEWRGEQKLEVVVVVGGECEGKIWERNDDWINGGAVAKGGSSGYVESGGGKGGIYMKEEGDEIVDDRENEDKKDEEDNIQGVSVKV